MVDGFAEYAGHRHERSCRTAYPLARDWATAADLVPTAPVKAWAAWHRIEGDPGRYVYRIIVDTPASWWRPYRSRQPVATAMSGERPAPPPAGSVGRPVPRVRAQATVAEGAVQVLQDAGEEDVKPFSNQATTLRLFPWVRAPSSSSSWS